LFFALWPDDTVRGALVQATRSAALASGGRLIPAENLHVTLLFLGSVEETRLEELYALSAEVADRLGPPERECALSFDILECWRKPRLLIAGVSDLSASGARAAESLASDLETSIRERGLALESQNDGEPPTRFRPHVTLVRDVAHFGGTRPLAPIEWRFTEFVLVDSKTAAQGSVYTVLRSFPLGRAHG
jgi:2'-5' RNA ligase